MRKEGVGRAGEKNGGGGKWKGNKDAEVPRPNNIGKANGNSVLPGTMNLMEVTGNEADIHIVHQTSVHVYAP